MRKAMRYASEKSSGPVGFQLATMALAIKTVTIPKGALHGIGFHPVWNVCASGLSCTRLTDFLPSCQSIGWDVVVHPGPVVVEPGPVVVEPGPVLQVFPSIRAA